MILLASTSLHRCLGGDSVFGKSVVHPAALKSLTTKKKKEEKKKAAVTVKPHKKPSYLAVKGGVPLSPTNDYQWLYKLIFASACS